MACGADAGTQGKPPPRRHHETRATIVLKAKAIWSEQKINHPPTARKRDRPSTCSADGRSLFRARCDFTHPFATNGSIRLPQVQRKALFFGQQKIPTGRKLNHPFAESTNWKQQLAESTIFCCGYCSASYYPSSRVVMTELVEGHVKVLVPGGHQAGVLDNEHDRIAERSTAEDQ
jgi:hypothetical protein